MRGSGGPSHHPYVHGSPDRPDVPDSSSVTALIGRVPWSFGELSSLEYLFAREREGLQGPVPPFFCSPGVA
jgi:hypothetical protein